MLDIVLQGAKWDENIEIYTHGARIFGSNVGVVSWLRRPAALTDSFGF